MKRTVLLAAVALVVSISSLLHCSSNKATGTVKVASPGVELQLQSGRKTVTVSQEKGEVILPAGRYKVKSIRLVGKQTVQGASSKQVIWTLKSSGPFGKLQSVTLSEGETTVLEGGPPLLVKAPVRRRGSTVYVGLQIVGRAGEVYSPGAYRGRSRVPAPKLKIVDQAGKVLVSGAFRYG